jgi:hypothetical protein
MAGGYTTKKKKKGGVGSRGAYKKKGEKKGKDYDGEGDENESYHEPKTISSGQGTNAMSEEAVNLYFPFVHWNLRDAAPQLSMTRNDRLGVSGNSGKRQTDQSLGTI